MARRQSVLIVGETRAAAGEAVHHRDLGGMYDINYVGIRDASRTAQEGNYNYIIYARDRLSSYDIEMIAHLHNSQPRRGKLVVRAPESVLEQYKQELSQLGVVLVPLAMTTGVEK